MAPTPKKKSAQLRIIAGEWRGRKLPIADTPGLRPTGDRMRETLFNWLQAYLPGANVLDAFAGTGALGLEALSRGAKSCVFFEKHTGNARQLQHNITTLAASDARVIAGDFCQSVHQIGNCHPFDLVFFDPPFDDNLWESAIDTLFKQYTLAEAAHIYIESPASTTVLVPATWTLKKSKDMGQVRAQLYKTVSNKAG